MCGYGKNTALIKQLRLEIILELDRAQAYWYAACRLYWWEWLSKSAQI